MIPEWFLRVTGRMQRTHSVTHVIAEEIEDIPVMLDVLVRGEGEAGLAYKKKKYFACYSKNIPETCDHISTAADLNHKN